MSHRLVYIAVKIISFVGGNVGRRGRNTLASVISFILLHADRNRRDVTRDNIRQAMIGKTSDDVESICRQSYRNLCQCYVELLATPNLTREQIDQNFHFENDQVLTAQAKTGRGLILVSAHFGNWEWAVQAAAAHFRRTILCVAKSQRNQLVDSFINECRTTSWTRVVEMQSAARSIVATLNSGGIVGMLTDQAADPKRDVFVQFFGRPAVTFEAPAALALRYHSDIVTAFAIRQGNGKYNILFKPVPHDDLSPTKEGIHELVQRISLVVESVVRQYPGQWSWQHKRWKYNPADYLIGQPHAH